jgi:hypothetical protein
MDTEAPIKISLLRASTTLPDTVALMMGLSWAESIKGKTMAQVPKIDVKFLLT